jgi:hypothetical protein
MDRYFARSSNDETDDWPFWFVADRKKGGLNVTAEVADALELPRTPGAVLARKEVAVSLAERANNELAS